MEILRTEVALKFDSQDFLFRLGHSIGIFDSVFFFYQLKKHRWDQMLLIEF